MRIDSAQPTIRKTKSKYDFAKKLIENRIDISPINIETFQVNITKLCNQACRHCHVDASPKRRESMPLSGIEKCLDILKANDEIKTLDITGGAPELHPNFRFFVAEASKLNKHIIVRHNLTVTLDKHPITEENNLDLPEFFASHNVEVVSSLPYYQEYFTDKQRGLGVFSKSIKSLQMLNKVGYGDENSELKLNLVYNPVGSFLPGSQAELKLKYKKELLEKFNIKFNDLFVLTNMPIHRFREDLERRDAFEEYMDKLYSSFNINAAKGIMCRSMISVSHDGKIYDCDFNQMLDIGVDVSSSLSIFDFDYKNLVNRNITTRSHCFGCTAGAGSSCGGQIE